MNTSLNAFHSAYYADTESDLKYKKNRENGSFTIRFSYADNMIIIARSYQTDIANIDHRNSIIIVSKERYSNTTGRQIYKLLDAAPDYYNIFYVDPEKIHYRPDSAYIEKIADEAADEAAEYLRTHEFKAKNYKEFNFAVTNYTSKFGDDDFIRGKQQERLDYFDRLQAKREARGFVPRRSQSEIQKERQENFESLLAQGVPAIIARKRAKYTEMQPYASQKVFIWSGRLKDEIHTTGGVHFSAQHAAAFANFENWKEGDRVLTFRFDGFDKDGLYIVGCHHIARAELESLRNIYNKAKEKEAKSCKK